MKFINYLLFSLVLVVSLSLSAKIAGALVAPIDDEPASQIVSYFNTESGSTTSIQITNTNTLVATPIHIQVIATVKTGGVASACTEVTNFPSLLTGADTLILDQSDLGIPDDAEGLVVIYSTTVAGGFIPADFPHLVASTWIVNSGDDLAAHYNSAGRNLVGGVFEFIQPNNILAPYDVFDGNTHLNINTTAWDDFYTAGGAYATITGTVTATGNDLVPVGIFNFDEEENPTSCGNYSSVCATCTGIAPSGSNHEGEICLEAENSLCVDANESGILSLIGITAVSSVTSLYGHEESGHSGLDYAVHTAVAEVVEPPVEECDSGADEDGDGLIDCADPDCDGTTACAGEVPGDPASCADGVDNDGDGAQDCQEPECDGLTGPDGQICESPVERTCDDELDNDEDGLTDCNDLACQLLDICAVGTGGGSSSGCSVAAATTGLGSMANALVLLIPAFGIGVRRIRRRLSK